MRLIEKLIAKRDAAHAEYVKWSGMIEVLQNDPDFISVAHFGATKVMQAAHALANGNGNGNGHAPAADDRSAAARKGWTPERRKKYSEMLKRHNPMHTPEVHAKLAKEKQRTVTLTKAQRKASADRMRTRLADPKFKAARLTALRKALKAKARAQKNGTPWQAKNAARIARERDQKQADA